MKRVVVTGVGVITSIGEGVENFWDACLNGQSGISEIKKDGLQLVGPKFGGQTHHFNPSNYVQKIPVNRIGRGAQLLIASIRHAFEHAKLKKEEYGEADLFVGTTMGEVIGEYTHSLYTNNQKADQNLLELNKLNNILVYTCKEFGLHGSAMLISNACAAGNYATIQAYEKIRNGNSKIAIAAGNDPFSSVAYYGFNRLNAISPDKCRPFDKNRKGMLVAEGSGCLILEEYQSARQRNAPILAEIAGYGVSADAFHITSPHPEAKGIISSTLKCLHNSDVLPIDVDYISAHGTGTNANDKAESMAIQEIFGESTPVSSIKSMLGHSMEQQVLSKV
jgi:3-oxoacyl-[acyl-carrier-protein] synthase II